MLLFLFIPMQVHIPQTFCLTQKHKRPRNCSHRNTNCCQIRALKSKLVGLVFVILYSYLLGAFSFVSSADSSQQCALLSLAGIHSQFPFRNNCRRVLALKYGAVSRKLQTCFRLCRCQALVVHDKDGVGVFSVWVIH